MQKLSIAIGLLLAILFLTGGITENELTDYGKVATRKNLVLIK